jgi:hypothetical protein
VQSANGNVGADLGALTTYNTTPQIPDKLNGGFISTDRSTVTTHEQIYGPAGTWTKIAFYVKMNSAPGVLDGEFRQWQDDQLVLETNKVAWLSDEPESVGVKWNVVAIGGNDWWRGLTNEERREEWYAIDDLIIADKIPEYLSGSNGLSQPMPPLNIMIQ